MAAGRARKRFGQHFLIDERVQQEIVGALRPRARDRLLEIGPGRGALTEQLAGTTARYCAVEIDRDLIAVLRARFRDVEILRADVLKLDLEDLLTPPGWRVVGNLPYNISSPLLEKLFGSLARIEDMHLMFQRELGARLAARPGSKQWGRLSVVAQYHCDVQPLFDVPPEAFEPMPRVHSTFVRLVPRARHETGDLKQLDRVLKVAFSARRKTARNAFRPLGIDWAGIDIDARTRPDQLTLEQFLRIANLMEQMR